MSHFRPCVIIPVYNHPDHLERIAHTLANHHLPVVFVDDGSERLCAAELDKIAATFSDVHLHRLAVNQGKGVAVCEGLRLAHHMGFTHALQVDADGQHDLTDIPRFLAAAEVHPQAVISGCRRYDDMPRSRRSGRKLTDFWVCINTLSRAIHDSMCGYRLYPLADTVALLERHTPGRRMDFDTDILVRLYWEGLSVLNLPVSIVYQSDIPSHFDVVGDNVRISWMHTRLFFGMLLRSPRLLSRAVRERRS